MPWRYTRPFRPIGRLCLFVPLRQTINFDHLVRHGLGPHSGQLDGKRETGRVSFLLRLYGDAFPEGSQIDDRAVGI
jgi:hypothetical protein